MANKEKQAKTAIGGQALLEGVMMRGASSMAMAVRTDGGGVLIETERLKKRSKIAKVPVIRGMIAFVNSLVLGLRTTLRASEVIFDDEDEKLSKGAVAVSAVLGVAVALGVFFFVPGLLADLFYNHVIKNVLLKSLVSGAIRLTLFVCYLAAISLLKDIRRMFMYHGAEHRTINCFEKGLPLTVENVQSCSTRHNRCGTTFLFLVMLISIIVFAFADWAMYKWIPLDGLAQTAVFMCIKLLLLPFVAGLSYEALFAFAKMGDNIFSRILRAPGLALQKLTTRIPDDEMAEIAIAAFDAVRTMDADESIKAKKFEEIPFKQARDEAAARLNVLSAEECELDWLLCWVMNCKRSELSQKECLTIKQYAELNELLKKREEMPLDYCFGVSSFFGRDVRVDKRVLIPRMETELLAEAALKEIGEREAQVLDLCTGSGCIAMTLVKESKARVTACDISAEALEVARENLKNTSAEVVESNLFAALTDRTFDVIVSNPPYIASAEIEGLQKEVRCQPRIALDGGIDGLDFYRRIAAESPKHLNEGGVLLLEIGFDQAEAVSALLSGAGFGSVRIIKDLDGNDRIAVARV